MARYNATAARNTGIWSDQVEAEDRANQARTALTQGPGEQPRNRRISSAWQEWSRRKRPAGRRRTPLCPDGPGQSRASRASAPGPTAPPGGQETSSQAPRGRRLKETAPRDEPLWDMVGFTPTTHRNQLWGVNYDFSSFPLVCDATYDELVRRDPRLRRQMLFRCRRQVRFNLRDAGTPLWSQDPAVADGPLIPSGLFGPTPAAHTAYEC